MASGRNASANGRNFGEREGGRRSWITGGEGLSTVRVALLAIGSVFNHFTHS